MTEPTKPNYKLPSVVLGAFLLTVIASRVLVYSIMTRRVTPMYLHVGGNTFTI
jgi:hypothetical protein